MNALDYYVVIALLAAIAGYGIWRTRSQRSLHSYLKGSSTAGWLGIGISVMATQASAITFLSTPGQGYQDGMGFVQNYFGAPVALIIVAAVFLPLFRRLDVYTAYEFLGKRFDSKTRLLGAGLFLIQRGLAAGITIYAPAIVLSAVFGWRIDLTILCSGLVVVAYTASGGSEAVTVTQKYQMGIILAGMAAAFVILVHRLPSDLTFNDALTVAGGLGRLKAVDASLSPERRYTLWSGLLGGFFLALSYFGTDQSQVQRYLHGSSLRESRLGLLFNGVAKVPMQAFILLLGALIFVFYQFEQPPVAFSSAAWERGLHSPEAGQLRALEGEFNEAHAKKAEHIRQWIAARRAGEAAVAERAHRDALADQRRQEALEGRVHGILQATPGGAGGNDADYVFITFVLRFLPHGFIGLLVAVIFAATMASKSAELNALGSTTTIDFYRHIVRRDAGDHHYVAASRLFTVFWGLAAIAFALSARLAENLIQAVNILGSIFYGVVLGLFLVAFFFRRIGGTAVFWSAVAAQALVFVLYFGISISYLWYNLIGCAACVVLSLLAQATLDLIGGRGDDPGAASIEDPSGAT